MSRSQCPAHLTMVNVNWLFLEVTTITVYELPDTNWKAFEAAVQPQWVGALMSMFTVASAFGAMPV